MKVFATLLAGNFFGDQTPEQLQVEQTKYETRVIIQHPIAF